MYNKYFFTLTYISLIYPKFGCGQDDNIAKIAYLNYNMLLIINNQPIINLVFYMFIYELIVYFHIRGVC